MFHSHRSEMYLASGVNLSRSEHHSFSSCVLSPYNCAHQRGTHVRESVCHDHGLVVGTWATVCRLSFLRRGWLSDLFLPKLRHFLSILLKVVGCSLPPSSVFRNFCHGFKSNLPTEAALLVIKSQRNFPERGHAEGRRTGWCAGQT